MTAAIRALLVLSALALPACGPDPSASVTDRQLIDIASQIPEVREFYSQHASVQPSVDRSGRLAVDFRGGTAAPLRDCG